MRKLPKREASIIRPTGPFKVKSRQEVEEEERQMMEAKQAPKLPETVHAMMPEKKKMAEGGMVKDDEMDQPEDEADIENHASVVAAIMARRKAKQMAEGGMVDIEDNAMEELADAAEHINEAALKENYDEDMSDMSQPENSNEHADAIISDLHDRISEIRKRIRKSPISR